MNGGIKLTSAKGGALQQAWSRLIDDYGDRYADRIRRGQSIARAGRVKHLWFAPGTVEAEVAEDRCTLRVTTFEEEHWQTILAVLRADLSHLASLFEGDLPATLTAALALQGITLLPSLDDLEADCSCGDYATPCPHVAALHYVLAAALDGDPLLLFTLRGRPSDQLMLALQRLWGDTAPAQASYSTEQEPASANPLCSPTPLPLLTFSPAHATHSAGLLELGPLPDDQDLLRALKPLYEAGAEAALRLALTDTLGDIPRDHRRHLTLPEDPPMTTEVPLPERIIDLLAESDKGWKSREMCAELHESLETLREHLLDLERLGVVYRTGNTKATRWWIG